MNDFIFYAFWPVALLGLYREIHVVWFFWQRRRVRRERFRGLRLVVSAYPRTIGRVVVAQPRVSERCFGELREGGETVCRCAHGHDGICGFQA